MWSRVRPRPGYTLSSCRHALHATATGDSTLWAGDTGIAVYVSGVVEVTVRRRQLAGSIATELTPRSSSFGRFLAIVGAAHGPGLKPTQPKNKQSGVCGVASPSLWMSRFLLLSPQVDERVGTNFQTVLLIACDLPPTLGACTQGGEDHVAFDE